MMKNEISLKVRSIFFLLGIVVIIPILLITMKESIISRILPQIPYNFVIIITSIIFLFLFGVIAYSLFVEYYSTKKGN